MLQLATGLLEISGHYVRLVGHRFDIPLFPRVSREQPVQASFWGNNTDLNEVMRCAAQGKIRHTIKTFAFEQVNEQIEILRAGDVIDRVALKF
jgi:alcohol dehydrogenase, propanol-preferring